MSLSGVDQEYVLTPGGRQIYARPLGNIAASMIGVGALATLALALAFGAKTSKTPIESDGPPPEAQTSPQPAEALVGQAFPFDLAAPEFVKEKKSFASRETEGGREDSLTLGQFAGSGPYLRLDLRRTSAEKRPSPDFFLDLTRHAAGAGLSAFKIGQPAPLATRFGAFEGADIRLTLAAPEGAGGERVCAAFRLPAAKSGLFEVAGLACAAGVKPMDRRALGCLIDRLEFAPGALAAPLGQFSQAADVDRAKACAAASAAGPEKTSWFEAHSRAPEARAEPSPPKHAKKAR